MSKQHPAGWRKGLRNYPLSVVIALMEPLRNHTLLTGFKDVYAKQIGAHVLELVVQDTPDGFNVDHVDRRQFDCDQSFMMQVIQTARLMTKEKHHA